MVDRPYLTRLILTFAIKWSIAVMADCSNQWETDCLTVKFYAKLIKGKLDNILRNIKTGRYTKKLDKKTTPWPRRITKEEKSHNPAKGISLILHFNTLTLLGLSLPTMNLGLPSFGPGRFSPSSSQGRHFGTRHDPTLINFTIKVELLSSWWPSI